MSEESPAGRREHGADPGGASGEEPDSGSGSGSSSGSDPDSHPEPDSSADPDPGTGSESGAGRTRDPDAESGDGSGPDGDRDDVPADVREYERFTKIDGARYERVNEFLRDRTYVTAREWAIARLCADFRTETGVEMTKIGENLPRLVPFMTDTYSPQAVNQARAAFEEKVRKAGATFLYGAMSGFFSAEELDETMYEATEVAKFLLEVEGVDLDAEAELDAESRVSEAMREVRRSSARVRSEEVACPNCGHVHEPDGGD